MRVNKQRTRINISSNAHTECGSPELHAPYATARRGAAYDMYTRTARRGAPYVFPTVKRLSALTYLSFTHQRKNNARSDVRLRRIKHASVVRSRLRRSSIAKHATAGRNTSPFAARNTATISKRGNTIDSSRSSASTARRDRESLLAHSHRESTLCDWTASPKIGPVRESSERAAQDPPPAGLDPSGLLVDSRRVGCVERLATAEDVKQLLRSGSAPLDGHARIRDSVCAAWERAMRHAQARSAETGEPGMFEQVLSARPSPTPLADETVAHVISREAALVATLVECPEPASFAAFRFLAGDTLVRPLAKSLRVANMLHPCMVVGCGAVVDLYQPHDSDTLLRNIAHEGKSAAVVRAQHFDCQKHIASPVWRPFDEGCCSLRERFLRCMRAINSVGPCWFHPIQATCWNHLSVWHGSEWSKPRMRVLPEKVP